MRQTGLPVLHSPSSGMSMAALQWKAHRQVITPSVANGRLPCDAIGSQRIESQSRAQESDASFPRPPSGVLSSCLWSSAAGDVAPGGMKKRGRGRSLVSLRQTERDEAQKQN